MLRKPGLGGFKPKAPVARRRPAVPSSSQAPDRSATAERLSKTPAPISTAVNAQELPPSAALNAIPEQPTPAEASPSIETPAAEPSQPTGPSKKTAEEVSREKPPASENAPAEEEAGSAVVASADVPIDPVLQPPTPRAAATRSKTISKGKATAAQTQKPPTIANKNIETNLQAFTANSAISLETASPSQVHTTDETAESGIIPVATVDSVYPDPEAPNGLSVHNAAHIPTPAASTDGTQAGADTALPSVEPGSQPAPAAAKKPRKRKAPATAEDGESHPKKARKPRAPRAPRTPRTAANPDDESAPEADAENAEAAPKKKGRKRKIAAENIEEADETEPKKSRRKRSVTPEDAEEQLVDPTQMTMGDLTKDLRIGKKFSRHDELRQRIRDKRSRARLIKLGRLPAEDQSQNGGSNGGTPAPGADGDNSASPAPTALKSSQQGDGDGVQYRMVDGQIVVDTRSLLVDRQARAAAQNGRIEEIEENDFTRPTTSATYMKPHKVGPNHWTDDETERFYEFLRKFGTDFNIIAAMFGGKKTRREVKLKFNREERYCPRRINACIVGKKEWHMDMDEIKNHTGKEFEDSKDIEAELARLAAAHEAEEKRAEEEIAEAARKKREALFGPKNGHRAIGNGAASKDTAADGENGAAAVAGEEEPEVDDQDMALQQPGKAKPKGRGRGKRGYGKATQVAASGFGL